MDMWECLGIERTADVRAIQRAYGRMAAKYHPEEHPEEFKKICAAYETAVRFAREQGRMERREQLFNKEIHPKKPADQPVRFPAGEGTDIPDKNIHPGSSADQPLQFSSEEGVDFPDRDMHSENSADESLHFPSEEGTGIPDRDMHSENSTDESLHFPSEEGTGIPDRDMHSENSTDESLHFPSGEKTGIPDESKHEEKTAARGEHQQGYHRLEEESDEDGMGGIQYPEIPGEIDVRKRRDPVAIAMGCLNDAFLERPYTFFRESALKNFVESDIFLEVRYKPEFQRRLCDYIREHPCLKYTSHDRKILYKAFDFQVMEAVLRQIPYPELKRWLKSGVGLEIKKLDIFAAKIYVFFRAIYFFFLWVFGILFVFALICSFFYIASYTG